MRTVLAVGRFLYLAGTLIQKDGFIPGFKAILEQLVKKAISVNLLGGSPCPLYKSIADT